MVVLGGGAVSYERGTPVTHVDAQVEHIQKVFETSLSPPLPADHAALT